MGQMLAFGRDRMLRPADVDNVVGYVQSLSDPAAAKQNSTGDARSGQGNLCRHLRLPVTAMTARGSATLARRT